MAEWKERLVPICYDSSNLNFGLFASSFQGQFDVHKDRFLCLRIRDVIMSVNEVWGVIGAEQIMVHSDVLP